MMKGDWKKIEDAKIYAVVELGRRSVGLIMSGVDYDAVWNAYLGIRKTFPTRSHGFFTFVTSGVAQKRKVKP